MQMKFSMALVAAAVLAGCASQGGGAGPAGTHAGASASASTPAKGATPGARIVKSRDGRFEGEMVGNPAPGSKFAKLQIGMEMNEVTRLIGGANRMTSNETGKRWIPFYYGNDVTRHQLHYDGEGCLTFTGGNHFGGGGNELIRITADPSGRHCAE